MPEFGADWYDSVLVADGAPSMEPLESSPWRPMYERVAATIPPEEEVVDLGCGTGRFIELLYQRDHYARITGVDWSATALAEAERYATPRHRNAAPPAFELCDLAEWEPDPDRAGNTVYTCTEVLEHLDDDLALVRRVPPGHRLVFSVPNYHSKAHVRTFPHVADVWDRYSGLLLFSAWSLIGAGRKAIHVVEAVKRTDAW